MLWLSIVMNELTKPQLRNNGLYYNHFVTLGDDSFPMFVSKRLIHKKYQRCFNPTSETFYTVAKHLNYEVL